MAPKKMLLAFLFIFLSFPYMLLLINLVKLPLTSTTKGTEALAFDATCFGPYTGVSDDRVLKYINPQVGFVEFSITSPNNNPALEPVCGRPLGLGFSLGTGDNLYKGDPCFGLVVLGPKGGAATSA
ncbi:hypothetical protein Q3G72_000529 [Acer saccharum]|nr:hypothetical protein Q3G72_000529 [Acer saccharum]